MGLRSSQVTQDCCLDDKGEYVSGPGPRQALRKWWLPRSRPPRPQGLAPRGASTRVRTSQVGPPTSGAHTHARAAAHRAQVLRAAGRPLLPGGGSGGSGSAAVRPGTSLRPAGDLAPRLEREGSRHRSTTRPSGAKPAGNLGPPSGCGSAASDPRPPTRRLPPRGLRSPEVACGLHSISPPCWQQQLPVCLRSVPRLTREAGGETP